MKRVLKVVIILVFVAGLLTAASYVGARATAGQFLGPNPPVGNRSISFALKGVEALSDTPRAWVFSYGTNQLRVRDVQLFISPTGQLLGTRPRNLGARLKAYEDSVSR